MNYVDEEQMDVMAFEMGQTRLRGSRFADKVEDVGRNIVGGLQAASQDQEGIGDDILRAGGKVLQGVGTVANLPGIKQGLQVLDAPFHYGSKLAGAAAERMGIDPRLGEWAVRTGELATGVGALKKAPKAAGKLATEASEFAIRNAPPGSVMRMVADTGGGVVPPPKAVKRLVPDKQNVWNIKKKDIPQMKQQLGEWLDTQYKDKGSAKAIKRKDFGTIIVDGESREISGLTRYLERQGPLPDLPKVVTRRQAKLRRIQREKPPTKEIRTLGRSKGLSTKEINAYMQEAQDSFASVQRAASRQGKPREFHAGHFYPAAKGGATSGRQAGIELGSLNISKGAKFEGTINLYAAEKAGIPTTWAEDMDMWIKIKKGEPVREYKVDFTNAQRDLIESIPWDWTEDKVNAFFKKHKLDPKFNKNREQMKAITDELTINKRRY